MLAQNQGKINPYSGEFEASFQMRIFQLRINIDKFLAFENFMRLSWANIIQKTDEVLAPDSESMPISQNPAEKSDENKISMVGYDQ